MSPSYRYADEAKVVRQKKEKQKKKNEEATVKKRGRPPADINWSLFEELVEQGWDVQEVAGHFRIAELTLRRRVEQKYGESISDILARFDAAGKGLLKTKQWELATKNPSMAIWLGKIRLKQKEQEENNESLAALSLLSENKALKEIVERLENILRNHGIRFD